MRPQNGNPIYIIALLAVSTAVQAHAALVTYSFDGYTGNEITGAPDTGSVANGVSASPVTRGNGITNDDYGDWSDDFEAREFNNVTTTLDPADNEYFGLTLTPDGTVDLDSIVFDWLRTGSGPYRWSVRTSIEGWSVEISNGTAGNARSVSFPDTAAYNSVSSPVEIRVFGYNANSALHWGGIDTISVNGLVTVVPEPASLLALLAAALILSRQRR